MDVEAIIKQIVDALSGDETLVDKLEANPVDAIAAITGQTLDAQQAREAATDAIMQVAASALGDSLDTLSRLR